MAEKFKPDIQILNDDICLAIYSASHSINLVSKNVLSELGIELQLKEQKWRQRNKRTTNREYLY